MATISDLCESRNTKIAFVAAITYTYVNMRRTPCVTYVNGFMVGMAVRDIPFLYRSVVMYPVDNGGKQGCAGLLIGDIVGVGRIGYLVATDNRMGSKSI